MDRILEFVFYILYFFKHPFPNFFKDFFFSFNKIFSYLKTTESPGARKDPRSLKESLLPIYIYIYIYIILLTFFSKKKKRYILSDPIIIFFEGEQGKHLYISS